MLSRRSLLKALVAVGAAAPLGALALSREAAAQTIMPVPPGTPGGRPPAAPPRGTRPPGVPRMAPPPPRREAVPPPRRGYVWSPGHWAWNSRSQRYTWVAGTWQRARPGWRFAGPQWVQRNGQWMFVQGRWVR